MISKLKYYKLPADKAKIFHGEIDECGLATLGCDEDDEGNWRAYHHHDSGTSLVVDYNPEFDKENAMMRIRGLEETIEETLNSLKILNLGLVEDN